MNKIENNIEDNITKKINVAIKELPLLQCEAISNFIKDDLVKIVGTDDFDSEIEVFYAKERINLKTSLGINYNICYSSDNQSRDFIEIYREVLSKNETSKILKLQIKRGNDNIDLESRILRDINSRISSIEQTRYRLLAYFINEDLRKTLGKTTFDDEIDLVRTNDGIFITTIFGSNYKINYRYDGVDVYRITNNEQNSAEEVKKVFSITIGPDVITNTIVTPKGLISPEFLKNEDFEVESTYEVNIPDSTFMFSCGEPGKDLSFKACLSGFNAKFSSHEMMNYYRDVPPVEHERNIFKRGFGKKIERGEGCINIATSHSLTELTDYADIIFGVLQKEAVKVIKKENSNYGKYLRAINEEI